MTRGLLLVALVALAVGCSTPPDAQAPAPVVDPLADEERLRQELAMLTDETREAVAAAVASARDGLETVVAAQRSVTMSLQTLQVQAAGVRAGASQDGAGDLAGQASEVLDRIAGLGALAEGLSRKIDSVHNRIDATQQWAEAVLRDEGAESPERRRLTLGRLREDAEGLGGLVVALAESSDSQIARVAQVSRDADTLRTSYREERERLVAAGLVEDPGEAAAAGPVAAEEPAPAPAPPRSVVASFLDLDPASEPVVDEDGTPFVAEVATSQGTFTLGFRPEVAPRHVANFLYLARRGFYDGLSLHRIIPGFVIQGGCPEGDGSGGPGWQVPHEFNDLSHVRGTLSMARFAHPDSAGSQFFICMSDQPDLDGRYTVFGEVVKGKRVLDAIEALGTVSGRPVEPVEIESITIRPRQSGERITSAPRRAARQGQGPPRGS